MVDFLFANQLFCKGYRRCVLNCIRMSKHFTKRSVIKNIDNFLKYSLITAYNIASWSKLLETMNTKCNIGPIWLFVVLVVVYF